MPINSNEARVVRFVNPYDFDYTHAYGGVPYHLPVGKPLLLPFNIGEHLATHLARQYFIRKADSRNDSHIDGRGGESTRSDRPIFTEDTVKEEVKKIITDAYEEQAKPVLTEGELIKAKVDELNRTFEPTGLPIQPPADNDHIAPGASAFPAADGVNYKDKGEVIAALVAKNIPHNPRDTRATLEKLLK